MALLDEVGNRLLTAITKATAGVAGGRQQTEQGFRAYFQWVADDHAAFLLLFGSRASRDEESTQAIRRITAGAADAIAPLIAANISADHRRTLAHGLVGLAEGVSRRLVEQGQIVRSAGARPTGGRLLGRPARRARLTTAVRSGRPVLTVGSTHGSVSQSEPRRGRAHTPRSTNPR